MTQIIGLNQWDSSNQLGATPGTAQLPKPELSAMEVIGLLTNMIGGAKARSKENNQDLQWRQAAKTELGLDLPIGMGKLYPEMVQKKFEAGLDPEKKLYESLLPGVSAPVSPTDKTDFSVMPGTQPAAAPPNDVGIDKSKLLRGLMSKKFGVPYDELMTPDEKAQRAKDIEDVRPPTQAERADSIYANRMEQAENDFTKIESEINNLGLGATMMQSKNTPNAWKSETIQSYEQAKRNFLNSVLRKESGAVISPTEFVEGNKQYFPQPFDKPAVLAQKKENRRIAREGMKQSAGKAYKGIAQPADIIPGKVGKYTLVQ